MVEFHDLIAADKALADEMAALSTTMTARTETLTTLTIEIDKINNNNNINNQNRDVDQLGFHVVNDITAHDQNNKINSSTDSNPSIDENACICRKQNNMHWTSNIGVNKKLRATKKDKSHNKKGSEEYGDGQTLTTACGDSPPYEIDYPTHCPTGRFSNGLKISLEVQGGLDYFRIVEGTRIIACYSFSFQSVAQDSGLGLKEEKVNTIQPSSSHLQIHP
ncbi:hypothetical protein MTR_7g008980 [Medicago truncatula]|uniref:Uncharacterized protein n=1 Tax=Medicago truncatula TaxID=3880 RepID=G7KYR4_MEDTR|nr:hypothetical protein MTR_7g008980 [Medicago truncatula]